jgi:hypothetical protein
LPGQTASRSVPATRGRCGRGGVDLPRRAVGRSWWSWTPLDWRELLGGNAPGFRDAISWPATTTVRPFTIALAYHLARFDDFHTIGMFDRLYLAGLVFGPTTVADTLTTVGSLLGLGLLRTTAPGAMPGAFSQFLLINRSPRLSDLTTEAFDQLREHPSLLTTHQRQALFGLQRAAAAAGHRDPPVRLGSYHMEDLDGVDPAWAKWVERWRHLDAHPGSAHRLMHRPGRRYWLPNTRSPNRPVVGRPARGSPSTMVGDLWRSPRRVGTPIAPTGPPPVLGRMFFRDCQEWEWFPRRFNPTTALAASRGITALIGTNPRIIADDVWAKLLWAGLNLVPADFPASSAGSHYPMELVRAVTLTWLFAGLRSDEINRLRVGCVRWQHDGIAVRADASDILATEAVCLLDIPVNKTNTAFTKPVDPLLGQAIETWQALRPSQPQDR